MVMLEKAWAKINGSYASIDEGNPTLMLRDLTGAPSFKIELDNENAIDILALGSSLKWILMVS